MEETPATPEPVEELLGGEHGHEQVRALLAGEVDETMIAALSAVWERADQLDEAAGADEGLRERKKRRTRQRISDIATALFIAHGFDNVTVAEVAEKVGVSEKTVYNYFSSKEALVFDQAESYLHRLTEVVRGRPAGVSPVAALVAALKSGAIRVDSRDRVELAGTATGADAGTVASPEEQELTHKFGLMITQTPALKAAFSEYQDRMVDGLAEVLGDELGVDPHDPEPRIAARALTGLVELYGEARFEGHAQSSDQASIQEAADLELDRGARLLETGLWSLQVMITKQRSRQQLRGAMAAAESARKQVLDALNEARRLWLLAREGIYGVGQTEDADTRAATHAQAAAIREQAHAQAAAAREQAHAEAAAARARAHAEAVQAHHQAHAEAAQAHHQAHAEAAQARREAREEAAKARRQAQEDAAQAREKAQQQAADKMRRKAEEQAAKARRQAEEQAQAARDRRRPGPR